jgi:hypothetical protein
VQAIFVSSLAIIHCLGCMRSHRCRRRKELRAHGAAAFHATRCCGRRCSFGGGEPVKAQEGGAPGRGFGKRGHAIASSIFFFVAVVVAAAAAAPFVWASAIFLLLWLQPPLSQQAAFQLRWEKHFACFPSTPAIATHRDALPSCSVVEQGTATPLTNLPSHREEEGL